MRRQPGICKLNVCEVSRSQLLSIVQGISITKQQYSNYPMTGMRFVIDFVSIVSSVLPQWPLDFTIWGYTWNMTTEKNKTTLSASALSKGSISLFLFLFILEEMSVIGATCLECSTVAVGRHGKEYFYSLVALEKQSPQ